MKRILSIVFLLGYVYTYANDGVYFTTGAFLVPTHESSVSVTKEVLTITIGKDDLAMVDVYYEFYNPDEAKTVSMAFEAAAPENANYNIGKNISHPFIYDFKVEMNGNPLQYRNALVVSKWDDGRKVIGKDITLLDLSEWKHEIPDDYYDLPNALYNARLDSVVYADYGYMFEATFKPGINIVHHTYNYKMSYNIAYKYCVSYWLTPATRWANHRIDDFTLRIKNENDIDYFIGNDELFSASPFSFAEGRGDVYHFVDEYGIHCTLAVAHSNDAVLEWHAKNFAPQSDMNIISVDNYLPSQSIYLDARESKVVVAADGGQYRFIGTSGENYLVVAQDFGLIPKNTSMVETFKAENGQGILTIKVKDYKSVRVRQSPTTNSKVLSIIKDRRGEIPVVLKCLGLAEERDDKGTFMNYWYKVEVDGKIGYVRSDLMAWDAINPY